MDATRYETALDASELSLDLLNLPNADHTEIGERGQDGGGDVCAYSVKRCSWLGYVVCKSCRMFEVC